MREDIKRLEKLYDEKMKDADSSQREELERVRDVYLQENVELKSKLEQETRLNEDI